MVAKMMPTLNYSKYKNTSADSDLLHGLIVENTCPITRSARFRCARTNWARALPHSEPSPAHLTLPPHSTAAPECFQDAPGSEPRLSSQVKTWVLPVIFGGCGCRKVDLGTINHSESVLIKQISKHGFPGSLCWVLFCSVAPLALISKESILKPNMNIPETSNLLGWVQAPFYSPPGSYWLLDIACLVLRTSHPIDVAAPFSCRGQSGTQNKFLGGGSWRITHGEGDHWIFSGFIFRSRS